METCRPANPAPLDPFGIDRTIGQAIDWLQRALIHFSYPRDPSINPAEFAEIVKGYEHKFLKILYAIITHRAVVKGWLFAARLSHETPHRTLPFALLFDDLFHGNRYFDELLLGAIELYDARLYDLHMIDEGDLDELPKLLAPNTLKADLKKQSSAPHYEAMREDLWQILENKLLSPFPEYGLSPYASPRLLAFLELPTSSRASTSRQKQQAGRPNAAPVVKQVFLKRRLEERPLKTKTIETRAIANHLGKSIELPSYTQKTVDQAISDLGYFKAKHWQHTQIQADLDVFLETLTELPP